MSDSCGDRPVTERDASPAIVARVPGANRRRVAVVIGAAAVAGIDLSVKAWAEASLVSPIPLGPVDLSLAYNSGVAFSMGAGAPVWLVIILTALVTLVVAVAAWRAATASARTQLAALAVILGGAVANLVDRAGDGLVTDYLHSGWFPTFNLADTAIFTGAMLMILAAARYPRSMTDSQSSAGGVGQEPN